MTGTEGSSRIDDGNTVFWTFGTTVAVDMVVEEEPLDNGMVGVVGRVGSLGTVMSNIGVDVDVVEVDVDEGFLMVVCDLVSLVFMVVVTLLLFLSSSSQESGNFGT